MHSTASFLIPEDICNRALNHIGADHQIATLADNSKNARLLKFVYPKLRQAELRNNVWRFAIRRAVMRPLSTSSAILSPPVWAIGTTYIVGAIVSYNDGLGPRLYISNTVANVGNVPSSTAVWENYFGPIYADNYSASDTYYSGDLVYIS